LRNLVIAAALATSLVASVGQAQTAGGAPGGRKSVVHLRPRLWFISIGGLIGGTAGASLHYERALTPNVSIHGTPGLELTPFVAPHLDLGARYYLSGAAPHGFSVGGSLGGILVSVPGSSALLLTPSAGVNYNGIWDSGFSMSVGIGLGYTIATAGGLGVPAGITIPFTFGFGYAF
jgi:hypothetical protein